MFFLPHCFDFPVSVVCICSEFKCPLSMWKEVRHKERVFQQVWKQLQSQTAGARLWGTGPRSQVRDLRNPRLPVTCQCDPRLASWSDSSRPGPSLCGHMCLPPTPAGPFPSPSWLPSPTRPLGPHLSQGLLPLETASVSTHSHLNNSKYEGGSQNVPVSD